MKNIILFIASCLIISSVEAKEKQSQYCQAAQQNLVEGDVVYISNHNYLFRRVEKDTLTWASHVGVLFLNEKSEYVVYESTWPKSKITPFCEFLGRSFDDKIEIRRLLKPISPFKIEVMKKAATQQLGIKYDQGFDYDDNKSSFCSKFVYKTFLPISVKVGVLETFQDLFNRNPEMDLTFWKYWFVGRIPYERTTVTPASQLYDNQFSTVFSHNNKQ